MTFAHFCILSPNAMRGVFVESSANVSLCTVLWHPAWRHYIHSPHGPEGDLLNRANSPFLPRLLLAGIKLSCTGNRENIKLAGS